MRAHPVPGNTYRQEFALDEAEDTARVASLGERVTVPFGTFDNVLKTLETNPLSNPTRENKFYARGIGNVLTVDLVTGEGRCWSAFAANHNR